MTGEGVSYHPRYSSLADCSALRFFFRNMGDASSNIGTRLKNQGALRSHHSVSDNEHRTINAVLVHRDSLLLVLTGMCMGEESLNGRDKVKFKRLLHD